MTYDDVLEGVGALTVLLVVLLNVLDALVAALEHRAARTPDPDDDVRAAQWRVNVDAFRLFVERLLVVLRPLRTARSSPSRRPRR